MKLFEQLERIRGNAKCRIEVPLGLPVLRSRSLTLPEDVIEFYEVCSGASLFTDEEYGFRIVSPDEFKPATPVIHRILYSQDPKKFDEDISASWYLIGKWHGPEENIVIDLHRDRVGRCYDGYVQTYASSDCKIVALSFTELLEGLLKSEARELFWERNDFKKLGYAYQGLGIEPPCG